MPLLKALGAHSVSSVLNAIAGWLWSNLIHFGGQLFTDLVLAPVNWAQAASALYVLSRNLAWMVSGVLLVWALLRAMWPELGDNSGGHAPAVVLHRAIAAALITGGGLYAVQGLLAINNAIVAELGGVKLGHAQWAGSALTLSPLFALVAAAVLVALLFYLGVFYALRTIEIFLLTALLPWLAVWWIQSADDSLLRNAARELLAAIFIQSLHAGAFWLFVRLAGTGGSSLATPFEAVGVLWYMTKLPEQFRRLLGTGGRAAFWPWR